MAEYGASNIKVLKGLEAVRKRPGMYIGDTSIKGLHHLVYEVVDNSIDEAMAGYCNTIKITLTKSNSVIIEDNGRGIPVAEHPTEKISAATVVLTVLHAGGKFDKDTYKVSGGLHGVGVSVVNALSKKLYLTIFKDGNIYEQSFKKGIPQDILTTTGTARKNGTKIEFWADDTIFTESVTFQKEILIKRFRELAYLNPKIKIDFRDERDGTKEIFHFEGGIKQFVEDMNRKEPLTTAQFFQGKADDIEIDIALMYCNSDSEKSLSFVNNIKTADGGTHEAGFRAGLTRSLARYISKNANAKERGVKITGEDCKEGLIAIVSVRVPEPQFEGQTKGKLGSSYVRPLVQKFFSENFNKYLEENPIEAKAIMSQVLLAARGRDAAKRAKDLVKRKDSMSVGTLPGKLSDCQTKDATSAEIYLVEGDSAGGCWSGETKVKCASGKDIEIAILAEEHKKGKVNFIYTYNHKRNRIELQKIKNAWQTKITDDLIYITLDNGKRELCTSDHLYMLRDGTYKPAKDLKIADSLMPLELKLTKEVAKIEKYKGKPIPVYDIEVPNTHNFALSSGVFVHNSAKQGRDRVFQAILPLKGKILNVEKARLEKILKSDEIKNMITALGCGIGDEFNEDKLRYHKIIIMTDADVDGCLKGDTKVKLLDGTYKSMEELEKLYPSQKDKFWVWASDDNGNPTPAEAHSVRVTKKVTKLYKIMLDNDYIIEATDNHPFRLIDGEYIRADKLVEKMIFSDRRVLKSIELIKVEETPVYDLTVDKYHNFAIKAGEDSSIFVHNSHIQTLLMTFFFRFLKPIIEKGYLYLAQPPLYRYKKGKNETYLKDDKALNDFLIENGIDVLDSYSMGKKDLTELFKLVAYYKMTLSEIEKRFALSEVIRYMIENPDIIGVSNQELSTALEKYIDDLGYNILTKSVNSEYIQYFVQTNDGLEELIVNETLFTSPYYNEAIYIYKKIEERLTDEFKDKDLLELLDKVEKSAKKGAYIQRYKGLGEMNPEQLWETTMNPEYRRLLRVVIDDDEIADDTFILFMGDEVEPRRAYIEKHAKDVKHLDV